MLLLIAMLLASFQCFNLSSAGPSGILLEDKDLIATDTFPVYQLKEYSNILTEVSPGDRIRSILSDDDGNWILVKTPEDWMGWIERRTLDSSTRTPSLDMGDYVREGYADLDGDGVDEFIQIVPHEWYQENDIIVDGEKLGYCESGDICGFYIVDVDSSDNYKEILSCIHERRGMILSYRDGKIFAAIPYGVEKSKINGDGVLFIGQGLNLGASHLKYIFNSEKGRFEGLDQQVYYVNALAEVENEIQIYPWIYSDKCMSTIKKGEIITLLACQTRREEGVVDQWNGNNWYLIKTSDDLLGWAEFRNLKDKLELIESDCEKLLESTFEDINGDGVKENIWLDVKNVTSSYRDSETGELVEYASYDGEFTLHVNDESIDGEEGEIRAWGFQIVDLNRKDNLKEIFVEIADASYVFEVVFRYEDGKIVRIGEIPSYWEIKNNSLLNRQSNEYWYDYRKLVVDEVTQQLVTVQQDMNYIGLRIVVQNDFPLYCSPDSDEIATMLEKGDLIEILAFDTDYDVGEFDWYGMGDHYRKDYWHLIKLDTGEIGWAQLSTLKNNLILPQSGP